MMMMMMMMMMSMPLTILMASTDDGVALSSGPMTAKDDEHEHEYEA